MPSTRFALPAPWPGLVAAALLCSACSATLGQSAAAPVELISFRPESRTLTAASRANSELTVRYRGVSRRALWVGYSVQDSTGRWYEVPATSVTIGQDEESTLRKEWVVPSAPVPGPYRVAMSLWSGPPGAAGSSRLLSVEQSNAFRVLRSQGLLMEEPLGRWRAAAHPIGQGNTRPDQVFIADEGFRLRMLAGRCDGAEVRSAQRFGFGTYSVRMKVPDAPGSLSSLSMYSDLTGIDNRLDFQITNGQPSSATLVSVVRRRKMEEAQVRLPFDARADFHDYTIAWTATSVAFIADGKELSRWPSGYATRPMRVVSRVWWPTQTACKALEGDRELLINSFRLNGTPQG